MSNPNDFVIENGTLKKYQGIEGNVSIPSGLTGIGSYAFFGCSSLTDIYYSGTLEQWQNIVSGIHAFPANAELHIGDDVQPRGHLFLRQARGAGRLEDEIEPKAFPKERSAAQKQSGNRQQPRNALTPRGPALGNPAPKPTCLR